MFNLNCKNICIVFITFLLGTGLACGEQFNVLLFTEAEGYHHQAIAEGVQAMRKLARKHNFDLKWSENSGIFADTTIHDYDVVVFLNTDGDVLSTEEQKGLKEFYRRGKGFAGIHGAAATEMEWEWYGKLVGRRFKIHPSIQTARINIRNNDFPATYHLPGKMLWTEEWYEFGEELTTDLNYIITVDEETYDPIAKWDDKQGKGMGDFHPIAWYHTFEGGRSFYTSLGHIGTAYQESALLEHIYGGIYWAAQGGTKDN